MNIKKNMQRLWETNHSYHGPDMSWCDRKASLDNSDLIWESWEDFKEDGWYDADLDYNLLFRFDWLKEDWFDDGIKSDRLHLFWIGQRHGKLTPMQILIDKRDEPEIREWLAKAYKHLQLIWTPFSEI